MEHIKLPPPIAAIDLDSGRTWRLTSSVRKFLAVILPSGRYQRSSTVRLRLKVPQTGPRVSMPRDSPCVTLRKIFTSPDPLFPPLIEVSPIGRLRPSILKQGSFTCPPRRVTPCTRSYCIRRLSTVSGLYAWRNAPICACWFRYVVDQVLRMAVRSIGTAFRWNPPRVTNPSVAGALINKELNCAASRKSPDKI